MASVKELLTSEQQKHIVECIRRAEKNTSAEIRVHLEGTCKQDPVDRAVAVFVELGMSGTKDRNGVLVYLAVKDHKSAILGDLNINKKVNPDFWDRCYAAMKQHFASGRYEEGICEAIEMLEGELSEHFPHQKDDKNELPDDISFGR